MRGWFSFIVPPPRKAENPWRCAARKHVKAISGRQKGHKWHYAHHGQSVDAKEVMAKQFVNSPVSFRDAGLFFVDRSPTSES
jgi:hypothetical protein